MDKMLNIIVDFSWLITILFLIGFTKLFFNDFETFGPWFLNTIGCLLLLIALCLCPIFFSLQMKDGHGSILSVIITQIIFLFFWIFFLFCFVNGEKIYSKLFRALSVAAIVIFYLYCICCRLKLEKILKNKKIDKIINKFDIMLKIMDNEWVKGISVGIITTVVGGLILYKITERKK